MIFLVMVLLAVSEAYPQQQIQKSGFSLNPKRKEPGERREMLRISKSHFVTVAKKKGKGVRKSTYALSKYNRSLKKKWSTDVQLGALEEYLEVFTAQGKVYLITNVHDHLAEKSRLKIYGFSKENGQKRYESVLDSFKVNNWKERPARADVSEDFQTVINTAVKKHYVALPNYQYHIRFSPNRETVLAYIYDFSRKRLHVKTVAFSTDFGMIQKNERIIWDGLINHGLYVNNAGDVYSLDSDTLGMLMVTRYPVKEASSDSLRINFSHNKRDDLKLRFTDNKELYVANLNEVNNRIYGVMYSKFNFNTMRIEKMVLHDISRKIKQEVEAKNTLKVKGDESNAWMNFDISRFMLGPQEQVFLVLEKRELFTDQYIISGRGVIHPDNWQRIPGTINVEGMLVYSFNQNDRLLWEQYFFKKQQAPVMQGLNTVSFDLNRGRSKTRILYNEKSPFNNKQNRLNLLEINNTTGKVVAHKFLENEENLHFFNGFSLWDPVDQSLILGGGKPGKKESFLLKYSLD